MSTPYRAEMSEALIASFDIASRYPFERVSGPMDRLDQQLAVARNYQMMERRVRAGVDSWDAFCPYEIADWAVVLTEPEFGAWQDIRSSGLPLWPRLGVGELVVSFGHPAAKVALQCSAADDGISEQRLCDDHFLTQLGWRVFRASYAKCLRVMDSPADFRERASEVSDEYRARYQAETLVGVLHDVRHALIARGASF